MSSCSMPEVFTSKTGIVARKEHKCCECKGSIHKGEAYYYCQGQWEGDFSRYRQHLNCKEACTMIRDNFFQGECIGFGELFEYYHEYIDPADKNQYAFPARPRTEDTKKFRAIMASILRRLRRERDHVWDQ